MLSKLTLRRRVALVALLVVAVAVVAAVRLTNDDGPDPRVEAAGPRIVIGFAGNPADARDREVLRGLRIWTRLLDASTRGIAFAPRRVAAVTVRVPRANAGADPAGATRELLRRGATVVIAPPDAERAAEVVEVVRSHPDVLLLSPVRRTAAIRRIPQAFFLARPNPYEFQQVYDVLALRRRASSNRVVILTDRAPWPVEARNAFRAAQTRGISATIAEVRGGDVAAALRDVELDRQGAILVTAPTTTAIRWFERARTIDGAADLPWVVGARDVPRADLPEGGIAVSVPWSPTSTAGGAPELAAMYSDLYGSPATADAAAALTLGTLLTDAAERAQTTVGIRLQRTMAEAKLLTAWGQVTFEQGEQEPAPPAQVVLASPDALRGIWPAPQSPQLLRRSVPGAAARARAGAGAGRAADEPAG